MSDQSTELVRDEQPQDDYTPTISFVYLFRADGGFYKIGRSADPERRVEDFAGLPFNIQLVHTIATDEPVRLEAYFHQTHKRCRIHGEWFHLSDAEIELFLNSPECLMGNALENSIPPKPWEPDVAPKRPPEESEPKPLDFPGALRREVQRRGFSLHELAGRAGVSVSLLSRWQAGLCVPSFAAACAVAEALGVDVSKLRN